MRPKHFLLLAALGPACAQAPEPAAPAENKPEASAAEPAESAHEHGEKPRSDLDRPVAELFAESCEHGKKTFECDECRYGVGVVRAPARLFDEGLLKRAVVGRQRLETPVALTGEVRFDESRVTHLSPPAAGILRKVHVSLGQKVSAGQPLLEIESVSFGEAEGEYLEAKAHLRLAQRSAERQKELREAKVTSEKEYLEAQQAFEAATIRVNAAGDKLVRLGFPRAELEALGTTAQATGRLVMRAPASGTVLLMHAVPGEAARPEESLIVLGDLSTLWLWADLYERELSLVLERKQVGPLNATVTVKAFPSTVFRGTVDSIGPVMDEATRTVKVRVAVLNPDGKLRAGMFANVQLLLPSDAQVLAAPASAVLSDEGRSFVFVHHHDDYYVRRPVEVGRSLLDWVEIKRGLEGGETLVTDGCFLLKSDVLRSKMGAGCAD